MPESEGGGISNRKRPPVVLFIIPLFFGLFGFYRVAQNAQFDSYRTVDVIQLVGSGACFGAALTGAMFILLRPRVCQKWNPSAELKANVKEN